MKFVARGACLVAFLGFAYHAILWAPRPTSGFAMYYTYARLSLHGVSLDSVYDGAWFNARVREFGFNLRDEPNNAPTAGLVYMPVAWLDPVPAKIIWTGISLAALALALKLLFDLSGLSPSGSVGLLMLTLVFLWRPAYDNVAFGQVYFILLLLFALSMKGFEHGGKPLTAVPLASALLVKGYGVIPAILLFAGKRWVEILLVLAVVVLVVIATLPLIGAASWGVFIMTVLPSLGSLPPDGHVAYQTINGFLRHLLTYDPVWLPHPAIVIPEIFVRVLSVALNLGVVCLLLIRARLGSSEDRFLSYSALLASGVVTAPLAEDYHYVLFLPLLFALAPEITRIGYRWKRTLLRTAVPVLALLVIAAPINYKALQNSAYPSAILAYPKLYAGLVILAFACVVLKRRGLETSRGPVNNAPDPAPPREIRGI